MSSAIHLDKTDLRLLRELEMDARLSWAELGRRVGLSGPGTRERVHRMEEAGVIAGYHARINPAKVGRPLDAVVRVAPTTRERSKKLEEFAIESKAITGCHTVTGDDSYILRVQVSDTDALDKLTSSLSMFGRTTTSIVLGSPVKRRSLLE